MVRCPWAEASDIERHYHDTEWGVPQHDDRRLFELLLLEGAQAGLSWRTILQKREGYRAAFRGFDAEVLARFGETELEALRQNPAIVRNRLKLSAAVTNARALLELQAHHGSFATYLWGFVDGVPIQNCWRSLNEIPPRTPLSDRLSRELQAQGFKFVGSTICYAFLQAVGLVNDHLVDCYRYPQLCPPGPRPGKGGQ